MTENHLKRLTYITMRSSISPSDNGVHVYSEILAYAVNVICGTL